MKNVNHIISRLSRSGLLARTARSSSRQSLKRSVTDTIIGTATGKKWQPNQQPHQTGALATVGRMAWEAYQVYSHNAYGRATSLQKANVQRAYMLGVYAQRNAQQQPPKESQSKDKKVESKPIPQSRYIPSTKKPSLTYSPASLSKQQFEKVVQDGSQNTGQMLILRAMITAANADGHIDENERQQIYQQVDTFELSNEDKASLFDELRHPLPLQALIKTIPNVETAIEVYVASVMAIDEQQPASQGYLDELASALSIPSQLVKAVHEQTGSLPSSIA